MKTLGRIVVVLILLFFILMLTGCFGSKDSYVVVNDYRQTNYPTSQCYDGTKTFSQIIVCLQEVDQKEKAQNNTTNEMLDKTIKHN